MDELSDIRSFLVKMFKADKLMNTLDLIHTIVIIIFIIILRQIGKDVLKNYGTPSCCRKKPNDLRRDGASLNQRFCF